MSKACIAGEESLLATSDSCRDVWASPQHDKLTAFTPNPKRNASQKAHSNSSLDSQSH
ncbi:hypothetical protein [Helicobacter marmotae]|uniref:hypothetical protein n=1 Tax=Helicobacter marmotae TaxID=152490 RepID=UPI00131579F6|nr:hypothetical protein [Helicobacter marmotae]